MSQKMISAVLLVLLGLCHWGRPVQAQDVIVGEIEFDRKEWGSRMIFIPVENMRDDTARLNIMVHTIYPQHYLSGLDRLEINTLVAVEPLGLDDIAVPMKMHGSFGRIITRVVVFWKFDNYVRPDNRPDSAFQIFNHYFTPKGDAGVYAGKKHSIGPVYSVMNHFLMNYEYPRLVLFLLSRGESVGRISALFEADSEYTLEVIQNLRVGGFFPPAGDTLAPTLLAVTESEGYALKESLKSAADVFSIWYENEGRGEINRIFSESGIDEFTGGLPSIRIPLLHTLLMTGWMDSSPGMDIPHFEDLSGDIIAGNQPRWIVQGGEFFLPKLCVGLFEEQGKLYMGAFSPDASLPFDKAPIYDMRHHVEMEEGSIVTIEAEQLRRALTAAREKRLVEALSSELKDIILVAGSRIENFKPYQQPYLADYIIRSILGEYFAGRRPVHGVDCIKVEY